MADRMQQYADWLVANQNKKGSPEFETVAAAYRSLRQQSQTADTPSNNPFVGAGKRAAQLGANVMNTANLMGDKIDQATGNVAIAFGDGSGSFELSDLVPRVTTIEEGKEQGLKDAFEVAESSLQGLADSIDYEPAVPWNEVKKNPSAANVAAFIGETAITSLPDMAMSLINTPAYFSSYIAPIAEQRAKNDGRSTPNAKDIIAAMGTSAAIAGAERFGAKGIFGQASGNVVTRPLKAGAKEAGTEAIQNPLEYAGGTVGTAEGFDTAQALDQALAGAVGGAGSGTGLRVATDLATGGGLSAPEDTQAAALLANRLDRYAKQNKFNPGNVSNNLDAKGARGLLDQVHTNIAEEIKTQVASLGKRIKKDVKNDTSQQLEVKTLADAAIRQARNKTKNIVGKNELEAVRQLVGNTAEGQRLISLMRESNELTRLHNQGLKGGLSKVTDLANPFDLNQGYDPRKATLAMLKTGGTVAGAVGTGGASLVPQAGIAATGRVIDALTGKRSNVQNYINQNKSNRPIAVGREPSLQGMRKAQEAMAAERLKTLNKDAFDRDLPITGVQGPLFFINQDTKLGRQDIAKLAEEMAADPANSDIKTELEQVQTTAKEGAQRVDNMSYIIARMLDEIAKRPDLQAKQTIAPPSETTTAASLDLARRQQGIDDNRRQIERLREAAMRDPDLNDFDKGLVNDALRDLSLDLGQQPIQTAERIIKSTGVLARNKGQVLRYLNPYLERIKRQQKRNKTKTEEQADQEPLQPSQPALSPAQQTRPILSQAQTNRQPINQSTRPNLRRR